jgi:hypothetical protein
MPEACTIEKPATVTDEPTISHTPEARHISARWPLRAITSPHEGDGVEYAVLSVSHLGSRRAYFASLNREKHFPTTVRSLPFDAARVGGLSRWLASAKSHSRRLSRRRLRPCAQRSPMAIRSSVPSSPPATATRTSPGQPLRSSAAVPSLTWFAA